MATKDKRSSPPNHPPVPFQEKRVANWGSILASVKDQLPSLDSDSSSSDCEDEELFIFQRDEATLIPDLSEELADLSPDDLDVQQRQETIKKLREARIGGQKFSAIPQKDIIQPLKIGWPSQDSKVADALLRIPEETPKWQKGDSLEFSERSTVQDLTGGPQGEDVATQSWERGQAADHFCFDISPLTEDTESLNWKATRRERKKMIKTTILHKETLKPSLGALEKPEFTKCLPYKSVDDQVEQSTGSEEEQEAMSDKKTKGLTLLSFQELNQLDLDRILRSLKEREDWGDHSGRPSCPAADPPRSQERVAAKSQDELMEQLVNLCAKQSKAMSSCYMEPTDKLCSSKELHVRRSRGDSFLPAWPRQGLHEGLNPRGRPEPPTVFIDLRTSLLQKSEQDHQEPGKDPSSSNCSGDRGEEDEEDEEDETQLLKEEEKQKTALLSPPSPSRDYTGKSLLLRQLRAFRNRISQPRGTIPEDVTGEKTGPGKIEEMGRFRTGKKQHLETRKMPRHRSPIQLEVEAKSSPFPGQHKDLPAKKQEVQGGIFIQQNL
ncbi:uncharacterized protein C16orf71 homolog isoform X3 [Tachyglossus aculeatus]|uniref:uncharacterized protein C16orf71 homolog isoform X3 n=1 Tax=Tachyglossus aculeatus TaxID=9261 RepID=UPI0018F557C6|nr:uncharacterized protein C16orf71 homolog isoform X3 [Tachyglossus aculeatus]